MPQIARRGETRYSVPATRAYASLPRALRRARQEESRPKEFLPCLCVPEVARAARSSPIWSAFGGQRPTCIRSSRQ